MAEWIRRILPACERWAENGFPITAEICRDPSFAWAMATMVIAVPVVVVATAVMMVAVRRGAPPRAIVWIVLASMLAVCLALIYAAAALLAAAAPLYAREILRLLSSPWFVPPVALAGVVLYALRARRPLLYGAIELFVGIAMLVAVSAAAAGGVAEGLLAKGIGVAGGVYVIVRGLDNMEKGLPDWLRAYWDPLLRGKAPEAPKGDPTPPPGSSAPPASPPRRERGSPAAPPR